MEKREIGHQKVDQSGNQGQSDSSLRLLRRRSEHGHGDWSQEKKPRPTAKPGKKDQHRR